MVRGTRGADDRLGEAEWIGSRIGSARNGRPALSSRSAARRGTACPVPGRDQDRDGVGLEREVDVSSVRLSRNWAPAPRPASARRGCRNRRDAVAGPPERLTASSRCGKGVSGRPPRSMTSAPLPVQRPRPLQDACDVEGGRFHDLGEDAAVVLGEVAPLTVLPKSCGKSLTSSGPRSNVAPSSAPSAASPPGTRPGRITRSTPSNPPYPASDNLRRHQRRDLHAEIPHLPRERRLAHPGQHLPQPRLGEVAGDEEQALRHRRRAV